MSQSGSSLIQRGIGQNFCINPFRPLRWGVCGYFGAEKYVRGIIMPKTIKQMYAPWQPQAAEVLRAYMQAVTFGKSMRELAMETGMDRNRLGWILNCDPKVDMNFWKRALTNFIVLARHGKGASVLDLLEEESRRMDLVKYSLTSKVKEYVAQKTE